MEENHVVAPPVWWRRAVLAVFAGAAWLSLLTAVISSPRSHPDERMHYSFIKYLADHPAAFPIRYERIRVDEEAVPNHLIHPPLYYYLMAGAYRLLQPDRHFTGPGRDYDRHTSIRSGRAVIPALRICSWLLVLVGFAGFYHLLAWLIASGALSPWPGLLAAAIAAFVPEFLYIGGGLNNDVLALALWPWAALSAGRFYAERSWPVFWRSVFLLAAMVLTKATLWPLAALLGILMAIALVRGWRDHGGWRWCWPDAFGTRRARLWACGAIFLVFTAGLHLGSNFLRYGSIQPDYFRVYGIQVQESKFYNAEVLAAAQSKSVPGIAAMCAASLIESLRAPIGHGERIARGAAGPWPWVLLLSSACLLFAARGCFSAEWCHGRFRMLAVLFLFALAIQFAVITTKNLDLYRTCGYVAARGRYIIGYLPLFLIGLAMAVSAPTGAGGRIWRRARLGLCLLGTFGLAATLCGPLVYVRHTTEFYRRGEMAAAIEKSLRAEGFRPLTLEILHPDWLRRRQAADGRVDRFVMKWPSSRAGARIPIPADAERVELAILARGRPAWWHNPRLGIGLDREDHGDHEADTGPARATIAISDRVEVYRVSLNLDEIDGDSGSLWLRLLEQKSAKRGLPQRLWPQTATLDLERVYVRFIGREVGQENETARDEH